MATLRLYRSRRINPMTKRWSTTRYRAQYPALTRQFEEFQGVGPPEMRVVPEDCRALTAGHLASGRRRSYLDDHPAAPI